MTGNATYPHCLAAMLSEPDRGRWLWLPCSWGWCPHGQGTPPQPPPTGRKRPCCHDDSPRSPPTSLTSPGTSARPGCCRLNRGSEFRGEALPRRITANAAVLISHLLEQQNISWVAGDHMGTKELMEMYKLLCRHWNHSLVAFLVSATCNVTPTIRGRKWVIWAKKKKRRIILIELTRLGCGQFTDDLV